MKTVTFALVGVIALLAGCSSGVPDNDEPVAKTALAGSIAGKSFKAISGTADVGSDGEASIAIYEEEVDCGSFGGKDTERMILTAASWKDGYETGFSLSTQTATLSPAKGENLVAVTGRIEVIKAGEGEKGTIRLRAYYDDDNQVEGEIDLKVCEGF